jgi:hypothetical protein
MALINTTTTGVLGSTFFGDGSGDLTVQQNGVTVNKITVAPTFSAGPSATQSISAATWTKMQYNSEEFDTNNNYDNATNYRFTPTVAGYYQVNGCAESTGNSASGYFLVAVYKNGSAFKYGQNYKSDSSSGPSASISVIVYFNGTTDYIELYSIGSNAWTRGGNLLASYFQASLIRAA